MELYQSAVEQHVYTNHEVQFANTTPNSPNNLICATNSHIDVARPNLSGYTALAIDDLNNYSRSLNCEFDANRNMPQPIYAK